MLNKMLNKLKIIECISNKNPFSSHKVHECTKEKFQFFEMLKIQQIIIKKPLLSFV